MVLTKKEMQQFFDLTKHQEREELMRKKAEAGEIQADEHQAAMLEYFIENLDTRMIMVIHSSDFFPEKGIIKPRGHYLFSGVHSLNAKKIIQDLKLHYPRHTIHFTLNYAVEGVVNSGQYFKWNCKYAVLIPFIDIQKRVVSLRPVDTWIIGEIKLPKTAEILMPETEYFTNQKEWDALAGSAKVVPYPKEHTLINAVKLRLKNKGYPVTNGGDNGWFEGTDLSLTVQFIDKSKFLTDQEKWRLKQVAIQRTYTGWAHLFSELAEKIKTEVLVHDHTVFRRIELFADQFYGFVFNPSDYEKSDNLSDFLDHFSFTGPSFLGLAAKANGYQDTIILMLNDKKFIHKEEISDLKKLKIILGKIEQICRELQVKGQLAHKQNTHITLGEFLKDQGIL